MNRPLHYLGTVALLAAATGTAYAQGGVALSDLLQGGSITAGDKLFDTWWVGLPDTGWSSNPNDPAAPDYSTIEVTPLSDGGDHPGPGLNIDFGNQMTAFGDGIYAYKDITIGFHVSRIGNEKKWIEDSLLNFGTPGGVIQWDNDGSNDAGMFAEEWVYDVLDTQIAHMTIEFSVKDGTVIRDFPDLALFAYQDEIFVKKNLIVWAVDATDSAQLNGVEQRFSQVPEPATLLLFGFGLAGAGLARRRRD